MLVSLQVWEVRLGDGGVEGKAGVNISQRRHETGGAHWAVPGSWPKAQAPPCCPGGVVVPRFCPKGLSLQLRLLPKWFQASSSSESGYQTAGQKAGDAGQLDAACSVLSHLTLINRSMRAEHMKAENWFVISGEAPKAEATQACFK